MSTSPKGTYVINSGWSSGSLVFYEKAVGRTATGDIFTIGASQVTVGGTGQDVDFLVYLGGASNYFKLDCGAATAAFYGVDVTVTGDLTIASEDLALGDNCSLEFGDAADVAITWNTTNLAIIPATDNTGEIQFGNDGTKSMDVRFYGATASYSVLWDMNGSTNGAWLFGADTYGVTVSMYGITTGCGVFWTPSGDSNNGTFIIGASGGSKGTDLYAYGATNGNYMQWDQSANSLLLVGTSTVLNVAGTTASTTPTTGAVILAGGVGIGGAVFFGSTGNFAGQLNADATTASSSVTTGALVCDGGLGVAGAVYIGGLLNVTLASLNATTGRIAKFDGTVLTPNFGDGYGAIECNLSIGTGAVPGFVAVGSYWANLAAGTTFSAGGVVSPLDVGIWGPTGMTLTNSKFIMGLKMSCVIDDGANPGELYLFNTNISANATTALFDINTIVDFAATATAASSGAYKLPFLKERSTGTTWYMNIYTS